MIVKAKSFALALICIQVTLMSVCAQSSGHQPALSQATAPVRPAERKKVVQVDWRAKLAECKKELARNPRSAFSHSQAAVAYNGLGDLPNFEREIDLAITLDKKSSIYCYFAYAVYKKRHLKDREIAALGRALQRDPGNPFGHYEKAQIFEEDGKWANALAEYEATKGLLEKLESDPDKYKNDAWTYVDATGSPYDVSWEVSHISDDLQRVRSRVLSKK